MNLTTLKMKTIIVLILAAVVVVTHSTLRCKFLKALKQHGLTKNEAAEFMCIADHASRFLTKCSVRDHHYGILQIHSEEWCKDAKHQKPNKCQVDCSAFSDDNFEDDIKCALTIKKSSGLTAWDVYKSNCKNQSLQHYLRGCGGYSGGPDGDDDDCYYKI